MSIFEDENTLKTSDRSGGERTKRLTQATPTVKRKVDSRLRRVESNLSPNVSMPVSHATTTPSAIDGGLRSSQQQRTMSNITNETGLQKHFRKIEPYY